MIFNCPGSQKFKQPSPDNIKCPKCGREFEIWSDEIQVRCPECKNVVIRSQDGASCLDWCKYAKDCVGKEVYSKYMFNKSNTIKEKLLKKLEEHFGADLKRINHAKKVLNYAEELLQKEQADWHIVVPASILHDVGIKEAEAKYGSSAGHYQEQEGPLIAKKMLLELGLNKQDIEQVCQIIAHHHSPGKITTQNFKVLYDADWLVNLKDEADIKDQKKLAEVIDKVFLTKTGRETALRVYIK